TSILAAAQSNGCPNGSLSAFLPTILREPEATSGSQFQKIFEESFSRLLLTRQGRYGETLGKGPKSYGFHLCRSGNIINIGNYVLDRMAHLRLIAPCASSVAACDESNGGESGRSERVRTGGKIRPGSAHSLLAGKITGHSIAVQDLTLKT